jgi:hypothetical protein
MALCLIGELQNQNHQVFMDNLYVSGALAKKAYALNRTFITGTYRRNFGVPRRLDEQVLSNRGAHAVVLGTNGDFKLQMLHIWDSKQFFFLSSFIYPMEFVPNRNGKQKFVGVHHYNNAKVILGFILWVQAWLLCY